jgi:hypothetical protein
VSSPPGVVVTALLHGGLSKGVASNYLPRWMTVYGGLSLPVARSA